MKRGLVRLNSAAVLVLVLFLCAIVGNALVSRQPWCLYCYKCKACNTSCVLGIDPQGFIDASLAGDPRVYIYTTNVRLTLAKAFALDPNMVVTVGEQRVTARAALEQLHTPPDQEVVTYQMQARHAASFCLRCGACERACVLGLPLLRAINQFRTMPGGAPEVPHAK